MSKNRRYAARGLRRGVAVAGLVAAAHAVTVAGWATAAHAAPVTDRVSVASTGQQANGASANPSVNIDGSLIAFSSSATNLVGVGVTAGQVYVRDTANRQTDLVSRSTAGGAANGDAVDPSISEDGRVIAFQSDATNLVPGDTNGVHDIFVRDRAAGVTTRISVSNAGGQGNAISAQPAISGDGRYVAFTSMASNLVGGDSNGRGDIFVHDRVLGQTTRASVGPAGAEGNGTSSKPSISRNGNRIAFHSSASNLTAQSDTNGTDDVFVASRTAVLLRASQSSSSVQGNLSSRDAAISADGRTVVYHSGASNLVAGDTNDRRDIFRHEIVTALTTLVSASGACGAANGDSQAPSISADGRRVAYSSTASNLVGTDGNGATTDVFVTDLAAAPGARNTLVSVSSGGVAANGASAFPALSHNGVVTAFHSSATNLVAGDTNAALDVFARTA